MGKVPGPPPPRIVFAPAPPSLLLQQRDTRRGGAPVAQEASQHVKQGIQPSGAEPWRAASVDQAKPERVVVFAEHDKHQVV